MLEQWGNLPLPAKLKECDQINIYLLVGKLTPVILYTVWNAGHSLFFSRYRTASWHVMTNSPSVSWAAYWLGVLWLRFMPAIPLPFRGGGVRKWQSYIQVLHMIGGPMLGPLPTLQSVPLRKATQGEAIFDVKWLKWIYCVELWSKKPSMTTITLSTLIRIILLLAPPLPWLNLIS